MNLSQDQPNPSELFFWWLGILLFLVALIAGWFMPEFYDWTGADQSRAAPVVGWIAFTILVLDVGLIFGLLVLHFQDRSRKQNHDRGKDVPFANRPDRKRQFSLLQLLSAITIVALLLTLVRWMLPLTGAGIGALVGAWFVYGLTVAWAVWVAVRDARARWRIALIVWLQFVPFLWLFRKPFSTPDVGELLGMLPALPAFFPSVFLNALFRYPFQSGQWISVLLSSLTFAIGIWVVRQGPKRSLAYSFIVITFSIFGSFILHALMRA